MERWPTRDISILFAIGASALLFAGFALASSPTELSANEAVELVRRINTAEAEFHIKAHSYVPLGGVLHHRFLKNSGVEATGSTSGTLKNYKISLIASPDGEHYLVELAPAGPKCGPSLFSDESGVIYTAKALGCPAS